MIGRGGFGGNGDYESYLRWMSVLMDNCHSEVAFERNFFAMDEATHDREPCGGGDQVGRSERRACFVHFFLAGCGPIHATRLGFRHKFESVLAHVYRTSRGRERLGIRSYVRLRPPWSANIWLPQSDSGPIVRGNGFYPYFFGVRSIVCTTFWGLGGLGDQHDPILILMLSLSLGLLAFFRWPRTITLNEVGISQRSLFGISRTIPYSEVEYVSYKPRKQTTFVVGPAVTTITHTLFHSDRELFHSLLEERTKKEIQVPR